MDDPEDPRYTLSFDLLYNGMEITTGGQRIHEYQKLLEKIESRGMTTEGMEAYLMAFLHGMPPHGRSGDRPGASDYDACRRRKRS